MRWFSWSDETNIDGSLGVTLGICQRGASAKRQDTAPGEEKGRGGDELVKK